MSIVKITVKEVRFTRHKDALDERVEVEREYTRESYSMDFDDLILDNMRRSDIKDYAEYELDMVDENDCDCDETDVTDVDTSSLIYELKQRGYEAIRCETIADNMRLEKVKELMQL